MPDKEIFVLKIFWRKSIASLHRLTQDVQWANLSCTAGDPTWVFRRIFDWFLKHIYHFQWILEESFDDFCTIIPLFIIKYPLVLWLSLLDEFLEEFMNYFFTQILITFIKYQSLALLCFLDELLEEFLNDHFLEEFLEDFFGWFLE